jgi:hypothetical protein
MDDASPTDTTDPPASVSPYGGEAGEALATYIERKVREVWPLTTCPPPAVPHLLYLGGESGIGGKMMRDWTHTACQARHQLLQAEGWDYPQDPKFAEVIRDSAIISVLDSWGHGEIEIFGRGKNGRQVVLPALLRDCEYIMVFLTADMLRPWQWRGHPPSADLQQYACSELRARQPTAPAKAESTTDTAGGVSAELAVGPLPAADSEDQILEIWVRNYPQRVRNGPKRETYNEWAARRLKAAKDAPELKGKHMTQTGLREVDKRTR